MDRLKAVILFIVLSLGVPIPAAISSEEPFLGHSPPQLDGVQDYSDRAYYPKVRELIGAARKTIDISMDAMAIEESVYDPVRIIMNDLIDAAKRGVRVRLFLNTETSSKMDASLFLRADYLGQLKMSGVSVHFVNPKYPHYDRLMIVDAVQILEGGPPWTDKGLNKAFHSATLSQSVGMAAEKKRRLELLPLWNLETNAGARQGATLAVPLFLLQDMQFFPSMVRIDDGDAIKIYLALFRNFLNSQNIMSDCTPKLSNRQIKISVFVIVITERTVNLRIIIMITDRFFPNAHRFGILTQLFIKTSQLKIKIAVGILPDQFFVNPDHLFDNLIV